MSPPSPHNPPHDREPTGADLSAYADGELHGPAARHVEAWLARHPDSAAHAEEARRLVRLYRDNPAPEPSPEAWQGALQGIEKRLARPAAVATRRLPAPPRFPWRLRALVGLVSTAAAIVLGLLVARAYWPAPPSRFESAVAVAELRVAPVAAQGPQPANADPAEDELLLVASASEITIISVDATDADRVIVRGQPLLGSFDLADLGDIRVVDAEDGPKDLPRPHLQRGQALPMIVSAGPVTASED